MAMSPQDFYDLIDLGLFTLVFGIGMFGFVAGHAAGTTISFTRKITHMST